MYVVLVFMFLPRNVCQEPKVASFIIDQRPNEKKNSKMQEEEEKHGGSDGSSSNSFQHRIGSVLAHVYILNHSCYWRLHNGQVCDENS